jgi:hypothetical protein
MSATVVNFPAAERRVMNRRPAKVPDEVSPKIIDALPFVLVNKPKGTGRCHWSVKPSGDYGKDYEQGQEWARLVLPFLKYNVGPPLLSWIVDDMIKDGKRNGLVLGFVREIGYQLSLGIALTNILRE